MELKMHHGFCDTNRNTVEHLEKDLAVALPEYNSFECRYSDTKKSIGILFVKGELSKEVHVPYIPDSTLDFQHLLTKVREAAESDQKIDITNK